MTVIPFGHGAGFGYASAVVLAGVFVRAGVAKAVRPAKTATGFAALGIPAAPAVARVVPAVELALAIALLAFPRIGAAVALVVLAAFSVFLVRAVRAGVTVGCNCFGQARADPLSSLDLVRNGLLGLLAAATLTADRPAVPGIVDLAVIMVAVAAGAAGLRSARGRHSRRADI
ncbi:MAG: MauE/DoxX family redox-associated membrane protein [Acidimicrobiales bacterium]